MKKKVNKLNKKSDKINMECNKKGYFIETKKEQSNSKSQSIKELKESIDNLIVGNVKIEDITKMLPIISDSTYSKLSDSEKSELFSFEIKKVKSSSLKKSCNKVLRAVNIIKILTYIRDLKFNLDMVNDLDINKINMVNGYQNYVVNLNYGKVDKYLLAVREYLANFDPLLVSSFCGDFIRKDNTIDYESYFNSPKVAYRFKDNYEKEKCFSFCEELKSEYKSLGLSGDCSSLVNQALDSTIIFAKSYENCDIVLKCKSKYLDLTEKALSFNNQNKSGCCCERNYSGNKVGCCDSKKSDSKLTYDDSKSCVSSNKVSSCDNKGELSDEEEETLSLFGGIMGHCKNCCDK